MSVRLREAQALAEGRELRQRVVELETQVAARARGPKARLPGGGAWCWWPANWPGRDPRRPAFSPR